MIAKINEFVFHHEVFSLLSLPNHAKPCLAPLDLKNIHFMMLFTPVLTGNAGPIVLTTTCRDDKMAGCVPDCTSQGAHE